MAEEIQKKNVTDVEKEAYNDGVILGVQGGKAVTYDAKDLVNKNLTFGKVEKEDKNAVSGGEVFNYNNVLLEYSTLEDKTMLKYITDIVIFDTYKDNYYLYFENYTVDYVDVVLFKWVEEVRTVVYRSKIDFSSKSNIFYFKTSAQTFGYLSVNKDMFPKNLVLKNKKANRLSKYAFLSNKNTNETENLKYIGDYEFGVLNYVLKDVKIYSNVYFKGYFKRLNTINCAVVLFKSDNSTQEFELIKKDDFFELKTNEVHIKIVVDFENIGNCIHVNSDVGIGKTEIHPKCFYSKSQTASNNIISDFNGIVNIFSKNYNSEISNNTQGVKLISNNEVEINSFLDSFLGQKVTFNFFGDFETTKGFNKHPTFNFVGYNSTIKMKDNALLDYEMCIKCTNGGSSDKVISHGNTFIKGFELDGNMSNNTTYNTLYGSGILHEIYNTDLVNFTDMQYITDVVVNDVKTKNFKRNGIVAGNGWSGKNISFENSEKDHGLYIAGGGNVYFENVKFKGSFKNGAFSVAGNNKLYQLFNSENIHLKNIVFDECVGNGAMIDIRGKFDNTNKPCNNVTLENVYIKNTQPIGTVVFSIGSFATDDYTKIEDYCRNVRIINLKTDVDLSNVLFAINRAQVDVSGEINIIKRRHDRPLFRINGGGSELSRMINLRDTNFNFKGGEITQGFALFGIGNDQPILKEINGINIDNVNIKSSFNDVYLFDVTDTSKQNVIDVNALNMNNFRGILKGKYKGNSESKINITDTGLIK